VEEAGIAARQAQQESRDKFERLFNNAEDAIFLHEITEDRLPGRIVEGSDAASRRQGYTREEFLDMSVLDISTPSDRGKAPDMVRKLLETSHAMFEGFQVRKGGSVFPVEVAAHLFTRDGEQQVPAIRRDITGRKEMEEQIRAALARIEETMGRPAIINDQIRNPLTVIVAHADMAPDDVRDTIVARSEETDRIIRRLDQGDLGSEKMWQFLRRQYGIGGEEETTPDSHTVR